MKTILNVQGMKCGGCETTVRTAVEACEGVSMVKPDHKAATVEVEYDETRIGLDAIKKVIADQGFRLA
jgi:copper chaperone